MTNAAPPTRRIGIDVGGTFTDFVLTDAGGGPSLHHKVPSRPEAPALAIVEGLGALMEKAGIGPGAIERIVHGTTIGLNALLQRRLAKVALVVTAGFGDIMVIGRGGLPNAYSYKEPKRPPLIPREHVFEIPARVRPTGEIVARPSEADIADVAARLAAGGFEAVGVLVLNSYVAPTLEEEIVAGLAARLPGVPVTGSAALWPEVREFERATALAMNAGVQPLMAGYYADLARRLAALGVTAPLHIVTSTGGGIGVATAAARPIDTLLSGPAAGVVAATRLAAANGIRAFVGVDMGGTSSDMSIAADGAPATTTATRIGEFPLFTPALEVRAIGAGGGSVLWLDEQGVLRVGPASAGADPGPVAYGRGGTRPTLTDCWLVLGLIDPGRFLGGALPLDRDAAASALAALAEGLGWTGADAALRVAEAAVTLATVRMASEVGKGFARRGLDPRDFTLIAFGGAGPTQAAMLAEEAGISRVLVPPHPGTFCALGGVSAAPRRDFARSRRVVLGVDEGAAEAVAEAVRAMRAEAESWIAAEGLSRADFAFQAFADMQYPRTATETTVAVPEAAWRSGEAGALADLFHAEHERLYTFRDPSSPVEVTTVRLTALGPAAPFPLEPRPAASGPVEPEEERVVHLHGGVVVAVHEGPALGAGAAITGPAVVELGESSVWVPPGWRGAVTDTGCLMLSRETEGR